MNTDSFKTYMSKCATIRSVFMTRPTFGIHIALLALFGQFVDLDV